MQITDYIKSGEPFDKAGGYGIQGAAAKFVDRVEGPYDNVVGLPMAEVRAALEKLGLAKLIKSIRNFANGLNLTSKQNSIVGENKAVRQRKRSS
jgi:hypothetical protein